VAKGVQIAPLVLHAGVASLEEHESPYAECYRVPESTARKINLAGLMKMRWRRDSYGMCLVTCILFCR